MNLVLKTLLGLGLATSLTACSGFSIGDDRTPSEQGSSILDDSSGPGLFDGLGGDKKQQGSSIGINSYLWRATLDTLSFMPLSSADPFGGVIITDWYTNPEKTDERFKATAYILDTRLRADGLKVAVFKQMNRGGTWVDMPVTPETELQIENAILMRARQLKLSGVKAIQ